jgi:plasmid stabilization system protein ParE
MKLVFDARALEDLELIFDWIAQDSPAAAKMVLDRSFASTELLLTFPFMGHAVRDTGALEWVVPRLPYVVVYEVDLTNDRITAAFHAAQNRDGGA